SPCVWVWSVGDQRLVHKFNAQGPNRCIGISPDGQILAAGGFGGGIFFLGLHTGESLPAIKPPRQDMLALKYAECLFFLPKGNGLVAALNDNTVRAYTLPNGREEMCISNILSPLCVAVSPDGKRLAVGIRDQKVVMLDCATGNVLWSEKYLL